MYFICAVLALLTLVVFYFFVNWLNLQLTTEVNNSILWITRVIHALLWVILVYAIIRAVMIEVYSFSTYISVLP